MTMNNQEMRQPMNFTLLLKFIKVKKWLVVKSSIFAESDVARLFSRPRDLANRYDRVREPNFEVPSRWSRKFLPTIIEGPLLTLNELLKSEVDRPTDNPARIVYGRCNLQNWLLAN